MFITKFLKPTEVTEVNTLGRCIKVMNCEGKFRIKATFQGEPVLETDARAGFDVQTGAPFDLLIITSEIEQKLELWASQHKLSYDALSTKASRATSFLAEHYGHSQQVIGYDTAQSRVSVMCDAPWWLGGEGVDKENGIPMAANEKYIHDSAAPLSAYIDTAPARVPNTDDMSVIEQPLINYNQHSIRKINDHTVFFGGAQNYIFDAKTGEYKPIGIFESKNIVGRMFESRGITFAVLHEGITEHSTSLGFTEGDSFYYVPTGIPTSFYALGCDEYNGDVYVVGGNSAGDGRAKIYKFSASIPVQSVDEIDTNIKAGQPLVIDKIFIDKASSNVWVVEGSNVYKGSIALNDFELVGQVEGILNTDPTFEGELVTFTTKPPASQILVSVVIHQEYGVIPSADFLGEDYSVIYTKDRLTVAYNVNGVYAQVGDEPLTQLSPFNNDVDITELASIMELDSKLYVFSMDSWTKRNALVVGLSIDKEVPRAIFRVYKESF